jgi:hypothetical protein
MDQTAVNNVNANQSERPAPPPPEHVLNFPEAILPIDPHHGVDTTYRKLFVGGLAWQVQQPPASRASTDSCRHCHNRRKHAPIRPLRHSGPPALPFPPLPAAPHIRAVKANAAAAAAVAADELREPATAFLRLRGECRPLPPSLSLYIIMYIHIRLGI